jgi:hypothetical protein
MIKATFPEGVTAMTVTGLTQWDYGQTLQIQASGLPALVEVHFACEGMNEAVVRSCAVTSGTLTAAIPDICLEQTSPVMAWVYLVGASSGITTLTVTLPVIARARPQPNATIPEDTSDKYTEAVAAMNEAAAALAQGDVTVARAIADGNGKKIPDTYATREMVNGVTLNTDILAKVEELAAAKQSGVYHFRLSGVDYETDENGKPINLPESNLCYGYATAYVWGGLARVFLWGGGANTHVYYNYYSTTNDTWLGWQEVVDSGNIGAHTTDLVKRADMVYSMKKTLSSVKFDTEYVLGTMPADLWGDGGSYIDPNESVLQVVVRRHSPDVELTASSGTNATKQKYQLHGIGWNPDSLTQENYTRHMAIATIWRMGSEVRFKITSYKSVSDDGSRFVGTTGADLGAATVRVDFHRAVTTA